jgi:aspartyl aminopeptidase
MESNLINDAKPIALDCIDFINNGPSPFHVVDNSRKKLLAKGFTEIHEIDNWKLEAGGRYFFTRNNTTLIAFVVGKAFNPNDTGFKIIGAHTDSPCLRLAPFSKLTAHGFNQACVQTYGGGLFATWLDRDLTLAGRVILKEDNGTLNSKLINLKRPVCNVPNLCIHLKGMDEKKKLEPNAETHLRPVFSTQVYEALTLGAGAEKKGDEKHYGALLSLIAKEAGVKEENLVDLELSFADTQPSQLVGIHEEFVSSPRLDNLFSSHAALSAILSDEANQEKNSFINLVCLFDHEEIGSQSAQGADSTIVSQNMRRIFNVLKVGQTVAEDAFEKAIQRSFVISADMAHSIHPNYPEKHQSNHQVKLNKGIVLKINANQRYATDGVGNGIIKSIAEKAGVPLQEFIVRNDSPCGSTIGPITAGQTGIKTIDIGAPQLAMHSIRELGGALDAYYYNRLMREFFKSYETLSHNLLYN